MEKEKIFLGVFNILCGALCLWVFFWSWSALCTIALPFMQLLFLLWLATLMMGVFLITPPGIMIITGIKIFILRKQKMHFRIILVNSFAKLVNCAFNAYFSFKIFALGNSQYIQNGIVFALTVVILIVSIFLDFYAVYKNRKEKNDEKQI